MRVSWAWVAYLVGEGARFLGAGDFVAGFLGTGVFVAGRRAAGFRGAGRFGFCGSRTLLEGQTADTNRSARVSRPVITAR